MSAFFSGPLVLTGASSFVGAHLASAFASAGADVIGVHSRALEDYDALRRARLDHAARSARLVRLDLRDHAAAIRLVESEKPAVWLHHVGYTENYTRPDFDWIGALDTTARPLAALYPAFQAAGTRVILTGTDQEYGAADTLNREDEACRPNTPYGLSKLAESLAARQLAQFHQVPTRIARVYIPFGRFDNPGKLLPQVVQALGAGRPIALSPGEQRRDFLGVADLCAAYLALAADMDRTIVDIFNISSGEPMQLRRLLETICGVMRADPNLLRFGELAMRPGEPPLSCGASDKARELLGWSPRPLERAIQEDLLSDP